MFSIFEKRQYHSVVRHGQGGCESGTRCFENMKHMHQERHIFFRETTLECILHRPCAAKTIARCHFRAAARATNEH